MLPSSMHICTWMCCLGKVNCCFWWGISFFKIFCILMMVWKSNNSSHWQLSVTNYHFFALMIFPPPLKVWRHIKKTLKVVLVRSEDRNMKRLAPLIQAISYLFSFAILYWQLFVKYMKILYEFFVIIFRHQVA